MCNPATTETHASGRSPKECSHRIAAFSADPPRQAKEGYEWVWFPEGYWAEREYRAPDTSYSKPSDLRIWRRRRQSRKSHSGSGHDIEPQTTTPKTTLARQVLNTPPSIQLSPYLSEEAHVQSLQYPLEVTADNKKQEGERCATRDQEPHAASAKTLPEGKATIEYASRDFKHFPSITWNRLGRSLRGAKDVCDFLPYSLRRRRADA